MKTFSTFQLSKSKSVFRLSFIFVTLLAHLTVVKSQTTYSSENFSTLFNGSETAPVNTTFQGGTGIWSAVSTDANSTIAVKTEVSSTDLKFVLKANNLGAVSMNTATSPATDLSMITCTSKFDFFFDFYGAGLTAGNTGASMKLELFDGTDWNIVWTKTADQLYNEYGSNTWNTVGLMISTVYMGMTNFRYRFITQNAAGNNIACSFYVDNVRVVNYSCSATAAVGNKVWNDINSDGIQNGGEQGIQGVVVKLAKAPGDTLTTTTDAGGHYMFTSLPPAGYKLVFPSVQGMTVTSPDAGNDELDSDISIAQKTVTVFLTDNETNTTIDAGFTPMSVLPVKLVSFSGAASHRKVTLKWVVADNQTVNRFILEKSNDGVEFSPTGIILGTDSNGIEEYDFADAELLTSKIFYRLKTFDKNEKSTYSKVLMISNEEGTNDKIEILGNPVTDRITFRYSSSENTNIVVRVYDMNGRVQISQILPGKIGMNTASITLPALLTGGMYIIELTNGSIRNTSRFIKQ